MENQFGYYSKDVAIELEITTSTLRRWSIELEKEGYIFHRNEKEQRVYYERDFRALREMKKLLSNSVPFKDAIKAIASRNFENENTEKTPSVYSEMMRLSKHELEEIISNAIEKEHEKMMKTFEEKLNDTIEMRDRILMQQINRTLEDNQKLIAAAEESENKKSWWQKIFNKNKK